MYKVEVYQAVIHLLSILILLGFSILWFILSFIYPGESEKDSFGRTINHPSGYSILCFIFCVVNAANTVGFFTCTLLKALVKLGYLS
jgi:hypothetical protein